LKFCSGEASRHTRRSFSLIEGGRLDPKGKPYPRTNHFRGPSLEIIERLMMNQKSSGENEKAREDGRFHKMRRLKGSSIE